MLETYFQGILLTSLLGIGFALILWVLKPLTQKYFSESWHYYIWLVILVAMLFPIRIEFPKLPHNPAFSHATTQLSVAVENAFESVGLKTSAADKLMYDEVGHRLYSPHLQERYIREIALERRKDGFVAGWLSIAVFLFLWKIVRFRCCVMRLKQISCEVECPQIAEYTRRKVQVRRMQTSGTHLSADCQSGFGNSPLLLGVFQPILVLPDKDMTEEQLRNVLAHEMTHLRRNDILYKWFVVLVKSVHWFNPFVHIISRQINQSCEISCDLSVTENMTKTQKMSYVDTILAFVSDQHGEHALGMGMTGNKKLLKKRFLKMKKRIIISARMRRVSGMVATMMLVCVMIVSGGMVAKVYPDLSVQNLTPLSSRCEVCGQEALYYYREPVMKKEQDKLHPYLNYFFLCDRCGCQWKETQKVTSDYVLNLRTNWSEKVEDVMAHARIEEVSEELQTKLFYLTQ